MVLAEHPAEFAGEEHKSRHRPAAEGDGWHVLALFDAEPGLERRPGWRLLAEELRVHPAHLVEPDVALALELFHEWRATGMGAGALPEAGGALAQAACTMRAFQILAGAYRRLRSRAGRGAS